MKDGNSRLIWEQPWGYNYSYKKSTAAVPRLADVVLKSLRLGVLNGWREQGSCCRATVASPSGGSQCKREYKATPHALLVATTTKLVKMIVIG